MADRRGFATFFDVPLDKIPAKKQGDFELSDSIPYKTSLFILKEIAPLSKVEYSPASDEIFFCSVSLSVKLHSYLSADEFKHKAFF